MRRSSWKRSLAFILFAAENTRSNFQEDARVSKVRRSAARKRNNFLFLYQNRTIHILGSYHNSSCFLALKSVFFPTFSGTTLDYLRREKFDFKPPAEKNRQQRTSMMQVFSNLGQFSMLFFLFLLRCHCCIFHELAQILFFELKLARCCGVTMNPRKRCHQWMNNYRSNVYQMENSLVFQCLQCNF